MKTRAWNDCETSVQTTEEPCEFERLYESASMRAAILGARVKELGEALERLLQLDSISNRDVARAAIRKAKGEL
jgi:hypothetical protein